MSKSCPKTEKCPLFNNNLLKRKESEEIYKKMYCTNSARYSECKRFQVAQKVGKCGDFVTPNSTLSVDEIIEKMKQKELI